MELQQKEFTQGWDPFFLSYSAAIHFHMSKIPINSSTNKERKAGGSLTPRCRIKEVTSVLEMAGFEYENPKYRGRRIILQDEHMAPKVDDIRSTKKCG